MQQSIPPSVCHDMWEDYIRQCSAFYQKKLETFYRTYFYNQIVEWSGVPVQVTPQAVQFLPNPPEENVPHKEILIHLNPEFLHDYQYKFTPNTNCQIRVQLTGSRLNIHICIIHFLLIVTFQHLKTFLQLMLYP